MTGWVLHFSLISILERLLISKSVRLIYISVAFRVGGEVWGIYEDVYNHGGILSVADDLHFVLKIKRSREKRRFVSFLVKYHYHNGCFLIMSDTASVSLQDSTHKSRTKLQGGWTDPTNIHQHSVDQLKKMSDKKKKSSNLRECLNVFFSINDINKAKMKININPTGSGVCCLQNDINHTWPIHSPVKHISSWQEQVLV